MLRKKNSGKNQSRRFALAALISLLILLGSTSAGAQPAFMDDFEDGYVVDWFAPSPGPHGNGTFESVTIPAKPTGGNYVGRQTFGSSCYGWLRRFDPATPDYISWHFRADGDTGHPSGLAFVPFQFQVGFLTFISYHQGALRWQLPTWAYSQIVPASTGTWYLIEIRNIDWDGDTFDIWVDGVEKVVGASFLQNIDHLDAFESYACPSASGPMYLDDITFGFDEEDPAADTDADGVVDEIDNCPEVANPDQEDIDASILFEDDFSTAKPEWNVYLNDFIVENGVYRGTANEIYHAPTLTTYEAASGINIDFDDFVAEFDFLVQAGYYAQARLLFRFNPDGDTGYQLLMNPSVNGLGVYRADPGWEVPLLLASAPKNMELGEWYHLKVIADGNHISVYDETGELLSFDDDTFTTGKIGFNTGYQLGDTVYYDNLKITSLGDRTGDACDCNDNLCDGREFQYCLDMGTPDEACCPANTPPETSVNNAVVEVSEGQIITNAGNVSDADDDIVALSASVGTATNNGDGTWSWSFPTSDGPAESQLVTITADDGNEGITTVSFDLAVNNVAPAIDSVSVPIDPVNINDQPISANATFSDPAGTYDEPYTCTVDYGDGSGSKAGVAGSTTCFGPDHTYTEPGVYVVTVAVSDKDDASSSATANSFIVIYDPEGGFVTGGGWIRSPEGAYVADPTLEGKATFGFVSKYKKGATVPTGNTEFQFKVADLNFKSTSYDWLVVNQGDANAQFKGEGTINGAGNYKFMLWAGDSSPDTFRIKIWKEAEDGVESVIYDNGTDQTIGGGSIVVHQEK